MNPVFKKGDIVVTIPENSKIFPSIVLDWGTGSIGLVVGEENIFTKVIWLKKVDTREETGHVFSDGRNAKLFKGERK